MPREYQFNFELRHLVYFLEVARQLHFRKAAETLAIANEETENLLDAAAFARMKPDAFFINMSRGNLVDEAALTKVLAEGRIAGAAMDVGRAPDQMPSPELARLPNVIATPHVGGLTPPASESQAMDTVRQVEALVKGEVPPGAANLDRWTRRV